MRRFGFAVLLAGAMVLVAGGSASAMNPCVQDAAQAFQACRETCKDTFTAARLVCRNIDPVCGSACVDGHQSCMAEVENILDTGTLPGGGSLPNCTGGTSACNTALDQARQACVSLNCPSGSTCTNCADTGANANTCYECVDPAQMTAFTCRDTCRDSFRQDPTVAALKKSCNTSLYSCIHACPTLPPPAATPTPTP